ncbi:MAG: HD domain-containing protein [Chloroflexi bacterium]|nr:HD domain-containing protein [Chloroflexota bacterium]
MTTASRSDNVRELFSNELGEIRDESLREKTLRTWVRAMEASGVDDLREGLPFLATGAEKQGDGVDHVRCVTRLALVITDVLIASYGSPIDRDVVAAGALLHDVGKLMEHASPENHVLAGPLVQHAFSGTHLAAEEGMVREVLHIIAYHSVEGQRIRRTLEAEIVHRSDMIAGDAFNRQERGKTLSEIMPCIYLPPHA